MNKKIVALLGACCLCFAVENTTKTEWEVKAPQTTKELKKKVETYFEAFFKNNCESPENTLEKDIKACIAQIKKEYREKHNDKHSLENGVKKAIIGALVIMEKESKKTMEDAKIEEGQLKEYIEKITNKYLDNL